MTVRLLDMRRRVIGRELNTDEAEKRLAILYQRVLDLEGEFRRRGIDADEYYRADQNCVCPVCQKFYRDHPFGGPLTYDHDLILRRLCNGELVKL